jgi:hypothetical protein
MANYNAFVRSNYFTVTDTAKFREIMASCIGAEGNIEVFDADDGSGKLGFGCYGAISGIPTDIEDPESTDLDGFYEALQGILAEGDAIIITEVGYEKLRYLIGVCTVITKQGIQCIDLSRKAVDLARTMLGNDRYTTQMDY